MISVKAMHDLGWTHNPSFDQSPPSWALELFKKLDSSNVTLLEMKRHTEMLATQNEELKRQNDENIRELKTQSEKHLVELKEQNREMNEKLNVIEQKTGETLHYGRIDYSDSPVWSQGFRDFSRSVR